MDGIQAWVALPERDEETEPAFFHHGEEALPVFNEAGMRARLITGSAFGATAPVKTHSPMFYLHGELAPGASLPLPDEYPERALYVASGQVEIEGRVVEAGRMVVFAGGQPAQARAATAAVVMAIGGEPVGPRFIEWNFVSSSRERIEQAKADWRAGRMKLPDLDSGEFIPLPPDPVRPANPMS